MELSYLVPADTAPVRSQPGSAPQVTKEGTAANESLPLEVGQLLADLKAFCTEEKGIDPDILQRLFSDLEARVPSSLCALQDLAAAFRQSCQSIILANYKPQKSIAAQASRILDLGNQVLQDAENGGKGSTQAAATPHNFWKSPADVSHLLKFHVHSAGCIPLTAVGRGAKRQGIQVTRYQDDFSSKRPRAAGSSKSKAKSRTAGLSSQHSAELSEALQVSIAYILDVLGAAQFGGRQDMNLSKNEEAAVDARNKPSKTAKTQAEKLLGMQAVRNSHILGVDWSSIVGSLRAGEYMAVEDVISDAHFACIDAAERAAESGTGDIRPGRLKGLAEQLTLALQDSLQVLAGQHARSSADVVAWTTTAQEVPLPASIQANREPYMQGDWRITPYAPRPYKRLKAYEISEERDVLSWKLTSAKQHACDGLHCTTLGQLGSYSLEAERFNTQCSCLARNLECSSRCGCAQEGKCLNRAVSLRNALVLGKDVCEIDSWGMDCYTRRNIIDAALESQAFGPYQAPDYTHAIHQPLKPGMANPLSQGETLQHSSKGADALIAELGEDALPSVVEASHKQKKGQDVKQRAGDARSDVCEMASSWLEHQLMPAINEQVREGWDITKGLAHVQSRAKALGDEASSKAAGAVLKRFKLVGSNYFRIHPKGTGIVCTRKGGLRPLTFVEEYLGEVHAPWRWFEIQDAIKKQAGDQLPDFYNIVLERPRDDPAGYDVLFIDAASKGSFASRMSHSCTPNCQAVVMSCDGRLTIAVYTLRTVQEGEELTFDYASVTENEREFKAAICLCSTTACRGSFLYFSGSRAFMQVMTQQHTLLHRQAILLRATEPLTQADRNRLEKFGLRDSALGRPHQRLPDWLAKWAALVLEFVEHEMEMLPAQLVALPLRAKYTPLTAAAEAKGVSDNRVQNVVITLDKVRLCLQRPGQSQVPPLRMVSEEEAVQHIWSGEKSVARRMLRCVVQTLSGVMAEKALAAATSAQEATAALTKNGSVSAPYLIDLVAVTFQPAADFEDARHKLTEAVRQLRDIDKAQGGGLTALADITYLYAATQHWFFAERDYKSFTSPPVRLNLDDLNLDRVSTREPSTDQLAPRRSKAIHSPAPKPEPTDKELGNGSADQASGSGQADSQKENGGPQPARARLTGSKQRRPSLASDFEQDMVPAEAKGGSAGMAKRYQLHYIWAQLTGWHKQTVYDPTASLSAERRGTITLPDLDSCCAGSRTRYTAKDRDAMLDHIEKRPDSNWKGSMWSFRNDAKLYGSPMFDAVWHAMTQLQHADSCREVVQQLRSAPVPWQQAPG